MNKDASFETGIVDPITETAVALTDHTTNYTNIESLDQQVKSMMIFSGNADPYKQKNGRARICTVCGKEGSIVQIRDHIEANHITGVFIPCDLCGKVYQSRNSLTVHKSQQHRKNQWILSQ